MKNLKYAQDHVNVVLRLNVDINNVEAVFKFLHVLKEEGIKKVRLDPHLVHENVYRNEYWDCISSREKEGEFLVKF